jgi:hypothetical protein
MCDLTINIVRKWKRPREFGEGTWEFEIGEPLKAFNPEADLLAPSGENVIYISFLISDTANILKKRHR